MKLDPKTIQILKNFATINPSIQIEKGNVLRTISPAKNVLAKATIDQEFDRTFAIYDLSKFLSALSLFSDPDLVFSDNFVTIKADGKKLNYTFAAPSTITLPPPPEKEIHLPGLDALVTLTRQALDDAQKAQAVLRLPELAFVADGNTVALQAINSKDPSADVYSVDLGGTDKAFKAVLKAENVKTLPGDYEVEISAAGITHFKGIGIDYWIALETSSTF